MQKYYHAYSEFTIAAAAYNRWHTIFYEIISKDKNLVALVSAYNKFRSTETNQDRINTRHARFILNELGIKDPRDLAIVDLIQIETPLKKLSKIEFAPGDYEIELAPEAPPPPSTEDLLELTAQMKKMTNEKIRQVDLFLLVFRFRIKTPIDTLKYHALTWLIKAMQYFV